jgi:hypothetical protein
VARVKVLIDNRSPTKEHWNYIVGVDASTNPDGLHMTISGNPIIINLLWSVQQRTRAQA